MSLVICGVKSVDVDLPILIINLVLIAVQSHGAIFEFLK